MNRTLKNGLDLLEMLSQDGGEYSVTELSEMAGLPSSSAHRLLQTLVTTGYLEQSAENRKYRVSLKVLRLSHARLQKLDLRRLGHPFITSLAGELKAPVFLSAPDRGRSIIVDVVWPREATGDPVLVVGELHSVSRSACGKVCAAFASQEEMPAIETALATERPGCDLTEWHDEFRRIREARFAVRREKDILAVAAPVFRAGNLFAGAVGVYFTGKRGLGSETEQAVRRVADAISFSLGQPYSD
jgi:IclR family KDG regulon transcriptional repressor